MSKLPTAAPKAMKVERRILFLAVTVALLVRSNARGAPSPARDEQPPAASADPRFGTAILPLLSRKCLRCHGNGELKADLDARTLEGLLKGGESGPAIVPREPEKSLLFEKVRDGEMPPAKKDNLTESEIELIRRWIAAGAPGGAADATKMASSVPQISQHDVLPILLRHCTVCHGRRRQEAGLDLSTPATILRGGKSGPAVVPGDAAKSLLVRKIRAGQMPPRNRLVEVSVKPVEPTDAETIARWIQLGAPEIRVAPDAPSVNPDALVTDMDRDFWSFRRPRVPAVPRVTARDRVRNPIDAFVLTKLESRGLSLSPEASRRALMRRAYFDVTGLPPPPAEVGRFDMDRDPDAYEKMIDRLLASPRYGERWGRYWLDLAGYADSEGKREQDLPRPHAWRYRDYVIRSLNRDKAYDRFLLEQIAGDELADYENAAEITHEIYDNLVATGFLRMAPDATWANITGYVSDRLEVIADEIDVLGSAVMGLTLQCARCHSHKFDPIPQRDYFRLIDVFKGAYDEHDWLKPDVRPGLGPVSQDVQHGRHLPHVTTAERRVWEIEESRLQREIDGVKATLDRQADAIHAKHLEERLSRLPEALRGDLRTMLATPADKRDAVQKYLAEKFEAQLRIDRSMLPQLDASFKQAAEQADRHIKGLEAKRRPEPRIQALWDRGEPSPTYLYRRGDPTSLGRLVGAGVPSVLTDGRSPFQTSPPWPGAKKTGRRFAFARWLVEPDHPLTARVMVNRIWKLHFGAGIVGTLGNFGKTGQPPSHPELLDWLAIEFVRQKWSIKAMHRLMLTSSTYRQASQRTNLHDRLDPANVYLARMPLLRLDAESLYDSLLSVAGRLDERPFGPADAVDLRPDGLATPAAKDGGRRRLIYVQQARKRLPTHLETFDFPQMNPNCVSRRDSTVATQALHLMNNGLVHELADAFARQVRDDAGADPSEQVDLVFLTALGRAPTAHEKALAGQALAALTNQWSNQASSSGPADPDAAASRALATLCHAVMNSAGFLYVD